MSIIKKLTIEEQETIDQNEIIEQLDELQLKLKKFHSKRAKSLKRYLSAMSFEVSRF